MSALFVVEVPSKDLPDVSEARRIRSRNVYSGFLLSAGDEVAVSSQ
jgi:hypothetical protein